MTATTTPLANGTDVGETLGGKLYGRSLLFDAAGADAMGVVDTNPAGTTILGRLKSIADAIVNRLPTVGAKTAANSVSVVPNSDGFSVSDAGAAPASNAFSITPHATNALSTIPRAIYVGEAGDVTLQAQGGGTNVLFKAVPAGSIIPVRAQYVRVSGTTAGSLVGLA